MTDITIRFRTEGGAAAQKETRAQGEAAVQTSKKVASEQARIAKMLLAEQQRAAQQSQRVASQSESEITRIRLRSFLAQKTGQQKHEQELARMIAQTTRMFEAETGKRVLAGSREAKQIERAIAQQLSAREAAEQRATRTLEREEQKRVRLTERAERERAKEFERSEKHRMAAASSAARAEEKSVNKVGSGFRSVGGGIYAMGQTLHGDVQSERRRRAVADRELGGALIQAGMTDPRERMAAQRMIAATALQDGIRYEDLVSATSQSQGRFNTLGRDTPEARSAALRDILENAKFANAMHTDMSQTTQFAGMLAQAGIKGDLQKSIVQQATQLSFMGSVEFGDTLQQGLGPLQQYIATELTKAGPKVSPEQHDEIVRKATLDMLAQSQLQAASGNTVRYSSGRFSNMDQVLQSGNTQKLIRKKLMKTFTKGPEAQMVKSLFDDKGALKKEFQNPVEFARMMDNIFKGDSTAFRNLMGAKGAGLPQALQKADTAILGAMLSRKDGVPMWQGIGQMVENSQMSQEQIRAAQDVTQNEELTKLNKAEEERAQQLTDNTNALVRVSNALNDFATKNPAIMAAVSAFSGMTATIVSSLGGKVLNNAANIGGGGGAGALKTAGGVGLAATVGLGLGTLAVRVADHYSGYKGPKNADGSASHDTLFEAKTYGELGRMIGGNDDPRNAGAADTRARFYRRFASVMGDGGEAAYNNLDAEHRAEADKLLKSATTTLDDASLDKLAKLLGKQISDNPPKINAIDLIHMMTTQRTGQPS